ncbi:YcxB family protein [Streptomyces siamensis]|uniref:YcxB-like C-terminal domain-containing protein n=1 Tax=Streptomyces siamensis TaxID=1274986 RepID=A0ABP9J7Y3_9ACTN
MAEGREVTDNGGEVVGGVVGGSAVQLVYRPQPADTLVGLRVRARIKRWGLVLRSVFLALWVGQWLVGTINRGSVDVVSTVLFLLVVLLVGAYPRLQAAQVQRTVGWQGEYRTTVSSAGITTSSDHGTLIQKWSVLQGYRETRGHFVLLSRDPNIMCLEVLPKHGLSTPDDVDRLRALLDRHTTRV